MTRVALEKRAREAWAIAYEGMPDEAVSVALDVIGLHTWVWSKLRPDQLRELIEKLGPLEGAPSHAETWAALADVRDLIWPPGFDRPDDAALAAQSATLAAIMERLAFIKPREVPHDAVHAPVEHAGEITCPACRAKMVAELRESGR